MYSLHNADIKSRIVQEEPRPLTLNVALDVASSRPFRRLVGCCRGRAIQDIAVDCSCPTFSPRVAFKSRSRYRLVEPQRTRSQQRSSAL